MPGMGLTSIGLAGVVLSYSEISHTFIDGLHALTGLTMFIGLIFLAIGILDGGVSTSNKAKATVLVVLSIALGFGAYAFTFNTISTTGIFAGILMAIAAPATIIAYVSMKHKEYLKPISAIFIMGSIAGISAFVAFGVTGPSPYLISEQEEIIEVPDVVENLSGLPEYEISMLAGSSVKGAPDYDPDEARVTQGQIIVWINDDSIVHTATSKDDAGDTFSTGLINAGQEYRLDTSDIAVGEYPYICVVHAWMTSVLIIEGQDELSDNVKLQGSSMQETIVVS